MTLKERLLALLKLAYEEEQKFYTSLGENEKSATGKLEQWSAKDIMAHIAYWKEYMVRNITATLRGESPGARGDVDTINEEVFHANKNNSWEDTLTRLERAFKSAIKCVRSVPDEMLIDTNTLSWQEGRPLWIIIDGNGYEHPIIHLTEYYFGRGNNDYAVKLYEQVAELTKELSDNPDWLGDVEYNLACCYALSGQHKRAIYKLRVALKLNPSLTDWSKDDSDLASIRKYNSYKSLYKT
jgi:tetratricopeptide (TPR) repeat protein